MTVRGLGALAALAGALCALLLAIQPAAADQNCHPKCTPVPMPLTTAAPPTATPSAVPPPTSPVPTLSTIGPSATPNNDPVIVQQSETSIDAAPLTFTPHGDANSPDVGRIAIIVMVISAIVAIGSIWLFVKLR